MTSPERHTPLRAMLVAVAIIGALTIAVFFPVLRFDFVHWDDDVYVSDNPIVKAGITWTGVKWAFSTNYFGNYAPFTWLSHMLDCQIFGMWAGGHHLTNLVLHSVNTLLLLLVLQRMTGFVVRSALVAALFAIHPQHVETVAWIADRKDLLSTLFWLLAIMAYHRYATRRSIRSYALVVIAFLLGLLAKPMLVTLPVTLLLLDIWPLERRWQRSLLIEKLPLFALALAFSCVTFWAQSNLQAVATLSAIPIGPRVANAVISYVQYIITMFAPLRLSAFYPHPKGSVSYPLAALCAAILVGATTGALRCAPQRRYITFGWFWYVVTLAPVIGLIQVGGQAAADRFTYMPFVGLFVILVWGAADLATGWTVPMRRALATSAVLVVAALAVRAHAQVYTWTDSESLFRQILSVSPTAGVAHYNLGWTYDRSGRVADAIASYRKAVEYEPDRAESWYNLGLDLDKTGKHADALEAFVSSDRLEPEASTKFAIGAQHEALGHVSDALTAYLDAIRLDPSNVKAVVKAAGLLERSGHWDEAIETCESLLRVSPTNGDCWAFVALAHQNRGRIEDAINAYREALRLNPSLLVCRYNLAILYLKRGDRQLAQAQADLLRTQESGLASKLDEVIRTAGSPSPR